MSPWAARDRILSGLPQGEVARLSARFLSLLDISERLGLKMMHPGCPGWPDLLSEIAVPPFFLWLKGDADPLSRPGLAVVGAREAGEKSRRAVMGLSEDLSSRGIVVVSGLARGVDGAAHRGALQARGRTIAVAGTGLDMTYPSDHRDLAGAIVSEGGLLLSEYPPGDGPVAWHFPHRNRLIVGLSLAVIAGPHRRRSGTYVTARIALEEGRELLVFDRDASGWELEGPSLLLEEGALRVENAEEVFSILIKRR